ncbi:MAG: hypothetical protein K2I76_00580 [Malacoplasma sp.]|nr:hypothetical protein [Malacoplasma sp.]
MSRILNAFVTSPAETTGAFSPEIGSGNLTFSDSNWIIVGIYLFAILCIGVYFSLESKFKKKICCYITRFFYGI